MYDSNVSTVYSEEALALIKSAMAPGEVIKDLCEFGVVKDRYDRDPWGHVTLVLTNQRLHFLTFKKKRREGFVLHGQTIVPFSTITSIVTEKGKEHRFFGKPLLHLILTCDSTKFLTSKKVDKATKFIDHMRQAALQGGIAPATSSGGGIAEEIKKLSLLCEEGILTQEELERAKEMFIGRHPNHVDESIHLLRQLRDLQKQGVLSESEFNMKKWDVLSKKEFQ